MEKSDTVIKINSRVFKKRQTKKATSVGAYLEQQWDTVFAPVFQDICDEKKISQPPEYYHK